jgi:hypothetical protein
LEFEGARGGVRNDGEADALDVGELVPVGWGAGDDDVAIELLADVGERSAADGVVGEVASASVRDEAF